MKEAKSRYITFQYVHFYYRTDSDPVSLWVEVLGVLTTALEISQASVSREAYLEAEILFNLGNFYSLDRYNTMNGISSFYCSDSWFSVSSIFVFRKISLNFCGYLQIVILFFKC